MNISDFSPEQMIEFCFSNVDDLSKRVKSLESEFVDYSLRVRAKKETFSEHKNNSFLRMIEILKMVQVEQYKFMQEFLSIQN